MHYSQEVIQKAKELYLTLSEEISPTGSLEVKYVYPAKDSTAIPNDSPIIVEFTVPIDESTLTWDNIELSSDGVQYIGIINYDTNSLTMTITDIKSKSGSSEGLKADAKFTLTLKPGIKTLTGDQLSSAFSIDFETGSPTDDSAPSDYEELKDERNMYQVGLIITIIIIILLLIALSRKGKQPEPPVQIKEPRPRPKGPRKTGARKSKTGKKR